MEYETVERISLITAAIFGGLFCFSGLVYFILSLFFKPTKPKTRRDSSNSEFYAPDENDKAGKLTVLILVFGFVGFLLVETFLGVAYIVSEIVKRHF
jgi:hypothetical protein